MRSPEPSGASSNPPLGVLEIARQVRSGERSPVEVVHDTLDAIGKADPEIGAFVSVDAEGALAQAEALASRIATARRSGGADLGPLPLAGVPVGVKDLEDAAGNRTTYGDLARAGAPPAARDSVQVARLRAAGAIVVGKTAAPQYGWKAETVSPLSGRTRNPAAPERTPGGSSGGSAAALASGMVSLATGSDGGGSIRIPAACCGLPGFKPTTGVVPAGEDHAPAWAGLSSRAPMARSFAEIALALDVVSGPSDRDPASLPRLGSFADAAATPSVEGLRVAWSPTLGYATPVPTVLEACEAAVARLETSGAVVEPVETVFAGDPLPAWLTLASVGLRQEILRHRPAGGPFEEADLDEGLRSMVERGASVTAAEYMAALDACQAVTIQLRTVWERFDVLACPVTADLPPRLDQPSPLGPDWVQFTYPFNLARCPAASVPAGFSEIRSAVPGGDDERVPVAVQLVAPRLRDLELLRAAAALEAG